MDDDVDMDAPQISTLHEDATPPPPRGSKFKVKLLVGDKKGKRKSSPPSVPAAARKSVPRNQTQPQSEEEVDEEDEEDQLIDDDEPAPSISAPVASVSTCPKRKAPPKKSSRSRKSDKQDKDDKKPDGESCPHLLYVVARGAKLPLLIEPREPPDADKQSVSTALPSPKKKAAPRKAAAVPKPKIKVPPKYVPTRLFRKQILQIPRAEEPKL